MNLVLTEMMIKKAKAEGLLRVCKGVRHAKSSPHPEVIRTASMAG